jgi:hypothetical protein
MNADRSVGLRLGEESPGWWHVARRAYDGALGMGDRFDVRTVLSVAAATGRIVHRVHRRCPSSRSVSTILPEGLPRPAGAIARDLSALRYQNRAAVVLAARRGTRCLYPLIEPAAIEALKGIRPPAILLAWHVGAAMALGAALACAEVPALGMRKNASVGPGGPVDVAAITGARETRSRAFARALARLKAGGLVAVAPDVSDVAITTGVPCLGRSVSLARGPFALARLTGAPLLPAVARWNEAGRIDVVLGPALGMDRAGPPALVEASGAASAAHWFDAYIREHPQELWFYTLRWLASAPRTPTGP